MTYGPYQNDDLVQLMVNTGRGHGSGLLYGIVYRAGPKTFSILWESDQTSRYEQSYKMDRAWFGRGMEQLQVEVTEKLRCKLTERAP